MDWELAMATGRFTFGRTDRREQLHLEPSARYARVRGPERAARERLRNPKYDRYGYSEETAGLAVERAKVVADRLTAHLLAQREAARRYIVGEALSALDIYWVYFSQAVRTFPEAVCDTPPGMRRVYEAAAAALGEVEPILVEHRDRILAEHDLPVDF